MFLTIGLAAAAPATILRCPDAAPTLPAAMPDVFKRVVRIETSSGSGSGVVVSPDGFVLTAAHVVAGISSPKIVFSDESAVEGTVVRSNASADLALVRVPNLSLPCLPVAEARLAPAADTWIVGSPGGKALTGSVTKGIVSGYRERDGWPVVQTDASMNPGNSGGPLLGADGRVQAIVSYKMFGGAEGLGFAVATESIAKALEISFGDKTDATIEPATLAGGTSATPFAAEPPSFKNKPDKPGAPPRGDNCRDATVGKDPFDDSKRSFSATGADLFSLTWTAGQDPIFTGLLSLRSDMYLNDVVGGPGGVALDLLLQNDTRIHMVSESAQLRMNGFVPSLAVRFKVNKEVAEAIAGSGPTYMRWSVAGNEIPIDQDRSDRQREKYYRPLFACLASQL